MKEFIIILCIIVFSAVNNSRNIKRHNELVKKLDTIEKQIKNERKKT